MKKSLLFLIAFLFLTGTTMSQWLVPKEIDTRRYFDNIPPELLNSFQPRYETDNAVTIDDWDNFNTGTDFAEPHIGMHTTTPNWVFTAFNINGGHWTKNGHDWNNITPNFGVSVQGDPVICVDSLGNFYYQSMFGNITGARVVKSTNGGETWGPAVVAISGRDKNWMTADQSAGPYSNYIYTTMTGLSSPNGTFARSTDLGATFQQTATFNNQVLPGMMVAVGPFKDGSVDIPGGSVYVVTHNGTNSAGRYNFFRSTDAGLNFTAMSSQLFSNFIGTEISGRSTIQGMRTRPYPMIAADNSYGPYRGRLYLVYASNFPAGNGNKPDIFSRYSTDGGATWSNPVTVNDDVNTVNNHNFFPAIWTDKYNGRLYVKWYDSRNSALSDSMDVYATYSDDGGVTFKPNQRITNKMFKIRINTGTAPVYQGDYDAIVSHGNTSMLVWTDFRNNSYGSYTGYFPDYAMRVTPNAVVLQQAADSIGVYLTVPAVKLYEDNVTFTATVSPTPATGAFQFVFPSGSNVLTNVPDSLLMRIKTSGTIPTGNYTVTVTSTGPNSIPVHRRTIAVQVIEVIPVELSSFSALTTEGSVLLTWKTQSETNNSGFEVQRAAGSNVEEIQWSNVGFVSGKGTTLEENIYLFEDKGIVTAGRYLYRLKQVDYDGTFEYSQVVEVDAQGPTSFVVAQNYPNPFNPSTTFKYTLPSESVVNIKIYDAAGVQVDIIEEGVKSASNHQTVFDASSLSSGAYFYSVEAIPLNGSSPLKKVMKMLLIK